MAFFSEIYVHLEKEASSVHREAVAKIMHEIVGDTIQNDE